MKNKILIVFLIMSSLFCQKKVGLIPINSEINAALHTKVKFSLDHFEKEKFDMVLVSIDTPGGEVFSAIKIARSLQDTKLPVVAFIDDWAISAGALIAYACPKIYARDGAIMGAAAPVQPTSGGTMTEASEKINSALRAQFRSTARGFERNEALAQAMVDKDLCLVERENRVIILNENEKVLESDHIICQKGKLLTLSGNELLKYKVIDALVHKDLFSHSDFKEFKGVVPKEFKNNKVLFFTMLQHPFVSSILSMAMMLGLYSVFSTGNFGVSFFTALVCGALTLLSQFSSETFALLEWILLAMGLFCLLAESFIPGFGVLGIFGVIFTLCGLVFMNVVPSVQWHLPSFGFSKKLLSERIFAFSVAISAFVALLAAFAKPIVNQFFKKSPLILRDKEEPELSEETLREGALGICLSPLKPWGKIDVCGKVYQVKSDQGYITEGKKVKITTVKKSTLFVREV